MTQHAINAEPLVFVVDDDIDVREGLKSLMGSVGLRCEVFASPRKFLEREAADTLSCLVLDVRLPEMGGLDFQAELAGTHADIPIIFITGHGDVPMSVKAMKAGAVEFLTKPSEQTLLDAVRDALERDRVRREQAGKMRELEARFELVSPREREVPSMVIAGLLNKQMAAEIKLSEVTVKVHRARRMKKLGAKSVADLTKMANVLGVAPRGIER